MQEKGDREKTIRQREQQVKMPEVVVSERKGSHLKWLDARGWGRHGIINEQHHTR